MIYTQTQREEIKTEIAFLIRRRKREEFILNLVKRHNSIKFRCEDVTAENKKAWRVLIRDYPSEFSNKITIFAVSEKKALIEALRYHVKLSLLGVPQRVFDKHCEELFELDTERIKGDILFNYNLKIEVRR